MTGVVVVGVCALLFLGNYWLRPALESALSRNFSTETPLPLPSNTLAPTRTPVPNLTATRQAWVRPAQSPSLGSAEEARASANAGSNTLESFAYIYPEIPEINQPGDVYVYEIQLTESAPLIWSYTWCTTTQAILEENFSHIQIAFISNGSPTSSGSFAVSEYERSDGSPCREHAALVVEWPAGTHQLETRVTFTQAINDGWNLYPAGTHTFKYMVTVDY